MMDEPRYTSTRLDPAAYADAQLAPFEAERIAFRVQCQIRDALHEAFLAGEHQGVCRAIVILAIARANARTAEARQALDACSALLVGEPRE